MSDVPAESDYVAPQSGPISPPRFIGGDLQMDNPHIEDSAPVQDLAALAASQRANPQIGPGPVDPPTIDGALLTVNVNQRGA